MSGLKQLYIQPGKGQLSSPAKGPLIPQPAGPGLCRQNPLEAHSQIQPSPEFVDVGFASACPAFLL